MSDGKSTVSKKVSEFTSDNVGAVKLAQLEKVNAVALYPVLYLYPAEFLAKGLCKQAKEQQVRCRI